MDTSPEYILQCEKAEEIQEYSRNGFGLIQLFILPENIDVLTINQRQYSGIYSTYSWALDHSGNYWLIPPTKNPCIWLPRQDQLQKMLGDIGLQTLTWQIHQFSESEYGSGITISGSMEQLWLTFAMKKKWNKVWDGENWVDGLN